MNGSRNDADVSATPKPARWLLGLFIAVGLSACGSDRDESPTAGDNPEVTPEEFAQELGVSPESGPRRIKPEDFPKYSLVVDVFRKSTSLPVLGEFRPEYIDLLVSDRSLPSEERSALAEKKFKDLASREFAIVTIRNAPYRAQIVSGGLEGYSRGGFKTTPPGNYRLDPIFYEKRVPRPGGGTEVVDVPYPWLRSRAYNNSIMYWGLWLFGGYFIHSTTHYGELGRPASMGCIRQTYPDAMELFSLAQKYRSMIRVHPIGSQQAYDRFREVADFQWALPRLDENLQRIRSYIAYEDTDEIATLGHAWIDPTTGKPGAPAWPECGPVDCFKIWGKSPPAR